MSNAKNIAAGRDQHPTKAELDAHARVGGLWRCIRLGQRKGMPRASHDMQSSVLAAGLIENDARLGIRRRWWALTSEGDITDFPEVTETP